MGFILTQWLTKKVGERNIFGTVCYYQLFFVFAPFKKNKEIKRFHFFSCFQKGVLIFFKANKPYYIL